MIFIIFILLTITGPIWKVLSGQVDLGADFRTANRQSAEIAPNPKVFPQALIQIYAAPAFNWRGMFALHSWIVTKEKNSNQFFVYQVIGWRFLRGLPPLMMQPDIPDRYWFDHKPEVIFELQGSPAEKLIPRINQVIKDYPFPNTYEAWPGPNSNTFVAYVIRQIPEMHFALPSNMLGKDFLGNKNFYSITPSGTGYQFSIYGVLGLTLAQKEGVEINILGLVYGIGFDPLVIKLPGFGDIPLNFVK